MKLVVAGGGVAGLAAWLAVARAGHEAVVLERDLVHSDGPPLGAFDVERRGIPHYFQPHAFLPRGRRLLSDWAPDVLQALLDAGADPQDVALKLQGPRQPGDEDLVYLWVRRPVIEWALLRAAAAEPAIEIRAGVQVAGLMTSENGASRAVGVAVDGGDPVRGDLVVDALGRYRCPPGWPRAASEPTDSGAIYYCRYFELAEGVEHLDAPLLNPRGDLGYMAFNRPAHHRRHADGRAHERRPHRRPAGVRHPRRRRRLLPHRPRVCVRPVVCARARAVVGRRCG